MLKTNVDTLEALSQLAKFLSRRARSFGIAGNKDKRGITSQRVTGFKISEDEIIKIQKQ